jgi:hypothetical protein
MAKVAPRAQVGRWSTNGCSKVSLEEARPAAVVVKVPKEADE